jgi:hypothetical protein
MIRHASTVGEAFPLEKGHVLVGDALSEFVEDPALPVSCWGGDGDRLPLATLRPVQRIEKELELALPADERRQSPFSRHVEPGPSGAGCNHPIHGNEFFFPLDLLLP